MIKRGCQKTVNDNLSAWSFSDKKEDQTTKKMGDRY